ncbi:BAG domain-containing protein [Xylariomycetidae sp. FL0641]|nr:BAG domain-containing protein [Xylariomycetidae sp. FL0641]
MNHILPDSSISSCELVSEEFVAWLSWVDLQGIPTPAKVASGQPVLASSGALQNITALLPPALQSYLYSSLDQLSNALAGPNDYLASKGASPTVFYSTLAGAAAVALPLVMSRYGWNSNRGDGLSPFAAQTGGQGLPHVTDEDFSYITSEDLEQSLPSPTRSYDPQRRQPPPNANSSDDILLIRNQGVTYPLHFPAYAIDDGKLVVKDVRDRAGLVMELSPRRTRHLKMLYKGRQLKEEDIPIRDYGVKNNSELMVVVPEGKASDEESSSSAAEDVAVDDSKVAQKSKKKKSKNRKKKPKNDTPRDSGTGLNVPGQADADSRRASPDPSRHPSRVPSPSVPSGPLDKLDAIRSHFDTQLLPLCQEFMDHPPKDAKKREDEHRKLSETVFQHVLLKLDEVETGGDTDIRSKRKELVNYVQDYLRQLDEYMPGGPQSSR